jgi:hypothetical protein
MGLLDDAIREHLELKRLRGADPTEIAHEEHAALDPVFPAEQGAATTDADDADMAPVDDSEDARSGDQHDPPADVVQMAEPPAEQPLAVASHVAQETAELDMQAVLAADADEGTVAPSADPVPAPRRRITSTREEAPPQDGQLDDDAFEWEAPGDDLGERVAEPGPGQERLTFE